MSFHKKQFLSLFNDTARYHHRHKVFRDFIALASTSIHNSICFDETLEREYMEIVRQYEAKDAERMAMLLAEVVLGLEAEAGDFLGVLYMQLELGELAGVVFVQFLHMTAVCTGVEALCLNQGKGITVPGGRTESPGLTSCSS